MPRTDPAPPRFVILRHEPGEHSTRALHWDFMIDVGTALRTWALANEPAGDLSIPAAALADHRLAYLELEGPISADRGIVTQWDAGTYRIVSEHVDRLTLELAGRRLRGVADLVRQPGPTDQWTFRFSSDRPATSV